MTSAIQRTISQSAIHVIHWLMYIGTLDRNFVGDTSCLTYRKNNSKFNAWSNRYLWQNRKREISPHRTLMQEWLSVNFIIKAPFPAMTGADVFRDQLSLVCVGYAALRFQGTVAGIDSWRYFDSRSLCILIHCGLCMIPSIFSKNTTYTP